MPDPTKVVAALRAALARMNDSGAHWTRGALYKNIDEEDTFCSLGAIMDVTGVRVADFVRLMDEGLDTDPLLEEGDIETREAAIRALAFVVPDPVYPLYESSDLRDVYGVITFWNDRKAMGWPDVQNVFAKAEQIAKEKA